MTAIGWIQIGVFASAVAALTVPLGSYLFRVFESGAPPLPAVDRFVHRLCGGDPKQEQTWVQYALSLLAFSAIGVLVTYAIQRLQGALPFNPQQLPGVEATRFWNPCLALRRWRWAIGLRTRCA